MSRRPDTPAKPRLVGVNEQGQVVGQDHHRAVLSDHEVQLLLEMRGEGFSYEWLSAKFEVSKSCVQKICTGRSRTQVPARYVRIHGGRGRG